MKDAEASLAFYTKTLGCNLEWNHQHEGRAFVFQVSLFGFEVILNQIHRGIDDRAGHGRLFIGLESDQTAALLQHIREHNIEAHRHEWGRPTLVIRDLDNNELFFWIPDADWEGLELPEWNYEGL